MILEDQIGPPLPPDPGAVAPAVPEPRALPAGFLRRGVAFMTDLFIFWCLCTLLLLSGALAISLGSSEVPDPDELVGRLLFPFTMAWFVLFFSYFTFFHLYGGQTPGKMLVRIKVTADDGGPLPPYRAFLRTLGYFLSGIFFLGFLLALIERRGRALHDVLARSEAVQS